jgi:hypothetical protein
MYYNVFFLLLQATTPYKYIQLEYNRCTQNVHVYLQITQSKGFVHVIDININTQAVRFFNCNFKDYYVYSTRFQDLYNVIVNMTSCKELTSLKNLLKLLTRCTVIEHVMFCMQSYVEYYKKIDASNEHYSLIKNFIMKLTSVPLEEALIDCKRLYERVNSMGPDRQCVDFESDTHRMLDLINNTLTSAINSEYVSTQTKIVREMNNVTEVLQLYKLQELSKQCQLCKKAYSYYQYASCRHIMCVKCAYDSLFKSKTCLTCDKFGSMLRRRQEATEDNDNDDDDDDQSSSRASSPSSSRASSPSSSRASSSSRAAAPTGRDSNMSTYEASTNVDDHHRITTEAIAIIHRNIYDDVSSNSMPLLYSPQPISPTYTQRSASLPASPTNGSNNFNIDFQTQSSPQPHVLPPIIADDAQPLQYIKRISTVTDPDDIEAFLEKMNSNSPPPQPPTTPPAIIDSTKQQNDNIIDSFIATDHTKNIDDAIDETTMIDELLHTLINPVPTAVSPQPSATTESFTAAPSESEAQSSAEINDAVSSILEPEPSASVALAPSVTVKLEPADDATTCEAVNYAEYQEFDGLHTHGNVVVKIEPDDDFIASLTSENERKRNSQLSSPKPSSRKRHNQSSSCKRRSDRRDSNDSDDDLIIVNEDVAVFKPFLSKHIKLEPSKA